MLNIRRISTSRWWHKKKNWLFFAIFLFLVFVRISKGAFYKDFYYFISKPFWPGPNQKEIVFESINQEYLIKLNLLRKDNTRLRQILSLQESSNDEHISAAVISRKTGSWWRQIILNKGSKDGVEIGDIVIGPGGLLGRVKNTSLFTSSVTLITSPESKLGVWVDRIQINGLLVGLGDDYPSLILYSKDADIKVGDFVKIKSLNSTGQIVDIDKKGGFYEVKCGSFRSTLSVNDFEGINGEKPNFKRSKIEIKSTREDFSFSKIRTSKNTIDVRGLRVHEAEIIIEEKIRKFHGPLWIVHGIGTGKLKKGLRNWLSGLNYVDKIEDAANEEGGPGCSIAWIK